MIRLRHYTRVSAMRRILAERYLRAGAQNKVFVERADRDQISARDAEARYYLKRGKGNAYIEFDATSEEVLQQINHLTGRVELYLVGDVDLSNRNPQGRENR